METMTLTITLIILLVVATVFVVRSDGYGHRPSPKSHESWDRDAVPFSDRS